MFLLLRIVQPHKGDALIARQNGHVGIRCGRHQRDDPADEGDFGRHPVRQQQDVAGPEPAVAVRRADLVRRHADETAGRPPFRVDDIPGNPGATDRPP